MTPEEEAQLRAAAIQVDKSLQEVFAKLEELRQQETKSDEEAKLETQRPAPEGEESPGGVQGGNAA